VLVVEDERKVPRGIEQGLRAAGYEVATAQAGRDGERLGLGGGSDAIVLDWMLPERDGLQMLATLRGAGQSLAVLLHTSWDAIDDRVADLDAGADDYLVKPFAFAELLARLRVMLRRTAGPEDGPPGSGAGDRPPRSPGHSRRDRDPARPPGVRPVAIGSAIELVAGALLSIELVGENGADVLEVTAGGALNGDLAVTSGAGTGRTR
jgi:DNA-binding response OmpR family regulator